MMAALANPWTEMGRPAGPPENDSPRTGGTLLASAPDAREIVDEGDFHLELRNRQATVRGRTLRLSAAEFDVLVYLLSHRRRLITSHTRLATRSADHEVRQAAFLPALLSLRKKLNEQAPGVPYINTEAWMLFEFHPSMGGR